MVKNKESKPIDFGMLQDLGSKNTDESDPKAFYKITEKEEFRKHIFHVTTHILAFIIIVPWIYLQINGIIVEQTFNTIVSVVVGFYFSRMLFGKNN